MYRFLSSSRAPGNPSPRALCFLFHDNRILLKKTGETWIIPRYADDLSVACRVGENYYIGSYDGTDCYAGLLSEERKIEGCEGIPLREIYYTLGEETFALAGRAFQTAFFHHHHLFCGVCGKPTEIKNKHSERICPACGTHVYPQQAPAVIMSVTRGDTILLARSPRFRNNLYSVLAGFVDPGESLEDAVKREVREECGIEVKNLRYFSSQSWPFPNSLMIGFTAEYASGEIVIDEEEIVDAAWYRFDNLPKVPDEVSISGRLIKNFVEQFY